MSRRRKVLVVRLDAIGDFVLWLRGAAALRQLYPAETHDITLLANQDWADLAGALPWWDRVIAIDRRKFERRASLYRLRVMFSLLRGGYDVALQPTFSREYGVGDAAVRASRAAQRIGSQGDTSNFSRRQKARSDRWYTQLVPAAPAPMHELQRNEEFVRALGAAPVTTVRPLAEAAAAQPSPHAPAAPYFVLAPSARHGIKQWPAANFGALAARLAAARGWTPVICGSAADAPLARALQAACATPCVDLTGRMRVLDLLPLLLGARLLVSNDTGTVHIAAAVGTPTLCLAGGGHWGRFVPYPAQDPRVETLTQELPCFGCNWKCIHRLEAGEPAPCVSGVSVETAFAAAARLAP